MKVVLPDETELELPEGATGLDAARAIGPKLAEQAVLLRSNGSVQDLRQPLEDGQKIQIVTTRDKDDPDALYVLRHSAAHLLAEAVRRLYPGVKIAIGPPIENGFYYDFEFPEPIREEDLEKIEAEIARELKEGREWSREEVDAEQAKRIFSEQGENYKVELVDTAEGPITLYTQGDFTDLCRGPHLQNSKPIKALKLTSLAGAYWRGDEHNKQLTRIYGTAFYSQEDLDRHLERLEEARKRDHRRLGRDLDLFHLSEHSPGSPFWHPKGMVIWNALEDLRRQENLKRGYEEVKTPLLYDIETYITSGHYDNYKENMFFVNTGDEERMALKPMNCPGHMLLFGSELRSYRDLPVRYAESSTLHRDEPGGTLHGLLRVRHITQDDAHVFVTEDQIQDEIDGMIDFVTFLYDQFGLDRARRALDAAGEPARHRRAVGSRRGGARGRAEAPRDGLRDQPRRGNVLRPEDRPAHDRRARPLMADGDDPARLPDADAVRPDLHGRRQQGAPPRRDPPRAARVARALHRRPDRALRRASSPSGWRRCRSGSSRSARITATPPPSSPRPCARRVSASTSTIATRRSASGSGTGELEKIPKVIVYGDRESAESLSVRDRGGEQYQTGLVDFVRELATLKP